jgi:hypothetical protein
MTEDNFLTRWSRRKREVAEAEPRVEAQPAPEEPKAEAPQKEELKAEARQKSEPEFDPASLPPLESINALTDITAFLRAGVPEELKHAALRRLWTADPAIRDFVGLAENAWDFTDPAAMPGFGPLESTEGVRRMVARIVDQIGRAAESSATQAEQSLSDSKELIEDHAADQPTRVAVLSEATDEIAHECTESKVLVQGNKVDSASQHDLKEAEEALPKSSRRAHGGALPR